MSSIVEYWPWIEHFFISSPSFLFLIFCLRLSYISYALGRILSARGLLMKRGLGYQDFKEEEVKQTYQLGVWGLVFQSLKLLKWGHLNSQVESGGQGRWGLQHIYPLSSPHFNHYGDFIAFGKCNPTRICFLIGFNFFICVLGTNHTHIPGLLRREMKCPMYASKYRAWPY